MFTARERWFFPVVFLVTSLVTSCQGRDYFQLVQMLSGEGGKVDDVDHTVVTNQFVDDHIQKLQRYVKSKGDTVELPGFSHEDTYRWLFTKGGYRLSQCRLNFLSRIARSSDSYLTIDGTVLTKLGMRGLQMQCDGLVWLGRLRKKLTIYLTADYILAEVHSKIPEWKGNVPEITDLSVSHMGQINVDIRGMGFFRKPLNAIVRSKVNKKREKIVNKINQIAVENINILLKRLPM